MIRCFVFIGFVLASVSAATQSPGASEDSSYNESCFFYKGRNNLYDDCISGSVSLYLSACISTLPMGTKHPFSAGDETLPRPCRIALDLVTRLLSETLSVNQRILSLSGKYCSHSTVNALLRPSMKNVRDKDLACASDRNLKSASMTFYQGLGLPHP